MNVRSTFRFIPYSDESEFRSVQYFVIRMITYGTGPTLTFRFYIE